VSDEQRPGDPADKAADGVFGGVQSHRAGYGDDKLARLTEWLRAHPTATLASGEGALLLAENDRLTDDLHTQDGWVQWAKGEMDGLRVAFKIERANTLRLERILAALREPSEGVVGALMNWLVWTDGPFVKNAIRGAVAAAEQEVGRE
jgi:hypothetical protein